MSPDITSPQNPRVKHAVKLREDKRQRQREGLMLVEGHEELSAALSAGWSLQALFSAPELARQPLQVAAREAFTVSRGVFEKMSYRENPDGWLGIFPIPERSLADLHPHDPALILVAESIEKPGNLGAILRSAEAAAADALLVCDPRVDLWNPNVIRASRGTLFSTLALETDNSSARDWLRARDIQILAATPAGRSSYTEVDLRRPTAVLVGTEDAGLSDFWLQAADESVHIPMHGRINSLNVSIAAALLLFETVRQRSPTR